MNLAELAKALEETCSKTGEFILAQKNRVASKDVEVKSLNSLVSFVDKQAEEQLVESLQKLLPEAGFIAEEGTVVEQADVYNWIIDPLDGTTNFLHGIPVYAISVALMEKDNIVLGVVYELGQKEMFTAWKGGGAYLNGDRIHTSKNAKLGDCLLATGFPYHDFSGKESFLKLLGRLFENTRGVRRLGSAATDLAYVACGRFDGFFEYGLNAWDVAAGALLVQEAGGEVSDYSKNSDYLFGGEILATNKKIHLELQQEIQGEL